MAGAPTSVYLPADLRDKVVRLADAQNRSSSSVIVEAVRMKFARKDEAADPGAGHRLARLEQRLDKAIRDGALVKESMLLFVRVWLEHNPPIEAHLEDSAAASAAARFERFLDFVANSIDAGRSLEHFVAPSLQTSAGEYAASGASS